MAHVFVSATSENFTQCPLCHRALWVWEEQAPSNHEEKYVPADTLNQMGQSGSVTQGFKVQILLNDDHGILLPSTSDVRSSDHLGGRGSPKRRL